ncbi:MAG: hypothetical protein KAQ85_02570 [Thermodesulfovibrionia bacterium]|nr:hypothetical protein [Thermodesulfovibrionia bacterium]
MSKKLWRFYFFSVLFIVSSCAPKVAPPPLYKGMELSLDEVITVAKRDIDVLKAIVSIKTEKNNELYSYVDASLLLKRPNWLHMRMYKFGMPVGNFLLKDDVVQTVSGKGVSQLGAFGKELYYSVFWWEDIENALMYKQAENYIIRTHNREIRLDHATLLPELQEITINDKKIYIFYDEPKKIVSTVQSITDLWYPSVLNIEMDTYRLRIRLRKLLINPPLNEGDFKLQ